MKLTVDKRLTTVRYATEALAENPMYANNALTDAGKGLNPSKRHACTK